MPFKRLILAIVLLMPVAARAASPATQPRKELPSFRYSRLMTAAEVRELLSDVLIGPTCCDAAEAFYRDGRYTGFGYSDTDGRYELKGDQACVRRDERPEELCYTFYVGEAGQPIYTRYGGDRFRPIDARPAPQEVGTLTPMSEAEVKQLIVGMKVEVERIKGEEVYYEDGRVSRLEHFRVVNSRRKRDDHIIFGRYTVESNKVCSIYDQEEERCYRFYTDLSGRTFAAYENGKLGWYFVAKTAKT